MSHAAVMIFGARHIVCVGQLVCVCNNKTIIAYYDYLFIINLYKLWKINESLKHFYVNYEGYLNPQYCCDGKQFRILVTTQDGRTFLLFFPSRCQIHRANLLYAICLYTLWRNCKHMCQRELMNFKFGSSNKYEWLFRN